MELNNERPISKNSPPPRINAFGRVRYFSFAQVCTEKKSEKSGGARCLFPFAAAEMVRAV
jgi:hypothetical protein